MTDGGDAPTDFRDVKDACFEDVLIAPRDDRVLRRRRIDTVAGVHVRAGDEKNLCRLADLRFAHGPVLSFIHLFYSRTICGALHPLRLYWPTSISQSPSLSG